MKTLYTFGIYLMQFVLWLGHFFNPKLKLAYQGRKNWKEKLKNQIEPDQNYIWMHCASLGEFEQGRPVLEALKNKYPNHKIALSFFSPSGYEIRKNTPLADLVFYHPIDTPKNARDLVKLLNPAICVLVKYDYWYHTLQVLGAKKVPVVVVSALMRENQIWFKPYGKWFAQQIKQNISQFFVQDKSSIDKLNSIGITSVVHAGDTRFDRVKTIAKQTQKLELISQFQREKSLMVLGSTWKEDEILWKNILVENSFPDYKFVIAPHDTHTERIQEILTLLDGKAITLSEFEKTKNSVSNILIIDRIGLLSKIYTHATLAYVGGGFNKSGVHNTLEPAVYQIPVLLGPNYQKFKEVKDLIQLQTTFSVKTPAELMDILQKITSSESMRNEISNKLQIYFAEQPSATQIISEHIDL